MGELFDNITNELKVDSNLGRITIKFSNAAIQIKVIIRIKSRER